MVSLPVITLRRNEEQIVLGSSGDTLLLHGAQGLGIPKPDVFEDPRIGLDGTVVSHVRYGSREVFLPVFLFRETLPELSRYREYLYNFLSPKLGPITIEVYDPERDTTRSTLGYYKDGASGDFGDDYHGHWQKLGLTFVCPDPWWYGVYQIKTFRVKPGVKPFISNTSNFFPVVLSQSVVKEEFRLDISGEDPVFPTWTLTGPSDNLFISNGTDTISIEHSLSAGETLMVDTFNGVLVPDVMESMSLESRMFQLDPGTNSITIRASGATADTKIELVYRDKYIGAI